MMAATADGGGGGSAPIVVQEDYKLAAAFTAIGVLSLAVPLFKVLPSLVCVTAGLGPLLSVEPGTGRSIEWQDYKGNLACALFGLLTLVPALGGAVWGGFCTVFGLFLAFQTYRVRFVFEDGAISVQNRKLPLLDGEDVAFGDEALVSSGENFAVGGENKWACSTVVNWEFFPAALVEFTGQPILVYFKDATAAATSGTRASANSPTRRPRSPGGSQARCLLPGHQQSESSGLRRARLREDREVASLGGRPPRPARAAALAVMSHRPSRAISKPWVSVRGRLAPRRDERRPRSTPPAELQPRHRRPRAKFLGPPTRASPPI